MILGNSDTADLTGGRFVACEDAEPSNSEGETQTQTNTLMLSLKRPPVTQLVLGLVVGLGLGLGLRPSTNDTSVDRARIRQAGHTARNSPRESGRPSRSL